jgi:hypothetical protein
MYANKNAIIITKNIKEILKYLLQIRDKKQEGLYFVGLDFHVGFLLFRKDHHFQI